MSQNELAKKLNVGQSTLNKIERGHRRLDVLEFLQICEAVGVAPENFLRRLKSELEKLTDGASR